MLFSAFSLVIVTFKLAVYIWRLHFAATQYTLNVGHKVYFLVVRYSYAHLAFVLLEETLWLSALIHARYHFPMWPPCYVKVMIAAVNGNHLLALKDAMCGQTTYLFILNDVSFIPRGVWFFKYHLHWWFHITATLSFLVFYSDITR